MGSQNHSYYSNSGSCRSFSDVQIGIEQVQTAPICFMELENDKKWKKVVKKGELKNYTLVCLAAASILSCTSGQK